MIDNFLCCCFYHTFPMCKISNGKSLNGVTHRGGGTTDGADYRLASALFDIDVEYFS